MADTKVSAFTDLASPAPANSYVPVIVTGDTMNYKAPLTQAGQPTRFLTLTYHHPGNEDGDSESESGIEIPDSDIPEGTAWAVSVQARVVSTTAPDEMGISWSLYPVTVVRPVGGNLGWTAHSRNMDVEVSATPSFTAVFEADSEIYLDVLAMHTTNNIVAYIGGMSDATPTDWTINVQLTPIAP